MKKAFAFLVSFFVLILLSSISMAAEGRIKEKHFKLQNEIIQVYLGFSFVVPDEPGIKIYRIVFKDQFNPRSPESHWKLLKPGTVTPSDGFYRIKSDGTVPIFTLEGPSNPNHDYPGSGTTSALRVEDVNLFLMGQWKASVREDIFPSEYIYIVCYVFPDNVTTLGDWRDFLRFCYNEDIQFMIPGPQGFFQGKFQAGSDNLVLGDLQFVIARTKKK